MRKINDFLKSKNDGIYYTGHASIIARVSGKNYLFDYVKDNLPYGQSWRFFPPLIDNIPLDLIDGIFVSHIHQDHYDVKFLKSNEINCPIYVIGGRNYFSQSLKENGINHISLEPNIKHEIDSEVYVQGFLHQSNGVDASCFIGNKRFSIYHGNDNYIDNNIFKNIDLEFENVDVACIPYAYINWYPQLLENLTDIEKKNESERLCAHYFEYAIKQANILNAKHVIPFGANLIYKDSAISPLNLECKTPLEFEEYVHTTRGREESSRFQALFSGDSIIKINKKLETNKANKFHLDNYRVEMQKYLDFLDTKKIYEEELPLNYKYELPNKLIVNKVDLEHIIFVKPKFKDDGVALNLKKSEFSFESLVSVQKSGIDYHIFNIKNEQMYYEWLLGNISLQEIIGSRKFSIFRYPNVYNPEILNIINTQL
jgi:L-ascorbate metabolism protein UlaG (beta-lactamase superfamily)